MAALLEAAGAANAKAVAEAEDKLALKVSGDQAMLWAEVVHCGNLWPCRPLLGT